MKKLFILITLVVSITCAHAQWSVGLKGGWDRTSIDRSQAGRIDETYEPLGGFDFGLQGRYAFNDWFALRSSIDLMQRNHRMQRHVNYIAPVHTDHRNTYLVLPVTTDFSFGGERLWGHLLLGGFASLWLNHHASGTTYTMSDYLVFFEDFDEHRNFDYTDVRPGVGLVGGVALSYRLNPMLDINFDALYYYDLTSHHRGYEHLQDYRYLNTLSVTFGISYKFRI